ncbi:thiamine pyrophosphate-binding protein [Sinimarinibacterium flocculans]|uniref:thiamine pyrophosphate-binding protein n=1 Tax=Sinimarinibacterium flocculans TaxID=985250 RepID=UPI003518E397
MDALPPAGGTVRDAFYQLMRDAGCRVMFGNPGSTELPMFRGFPGDMHYVLGLQEACVVGMADGYAQASGNAAFVNLHSAAGVGNAMGAIYTAFKNQTPLVIVAGQQYRALHPFDPYLFSRQVTELPRPYVKYCIEPARAQDVPLAIARAWQTAMQHPRGPVMVSVPADDWDQPCAAPPRLAGYRDIRPAADGIDALRDAIGKSERIAIVVGAAVDRDGAWEQVVRLAEACQAGVFAAPMSARGSFPEDHALFRGFLPAAGAQLRERLAGHDLVLVVGAPAFAYHVPRGTEGSHVPEGARLAVLTDDPEAAASVPEGLSVLGGIRLALEDLLQDLLQRPRHAPAPRPAPPEVSATDPLSTAYVLGSPRFQCNK